MADMTFLKQKVEEAQLVLVGVGEEFNGMQMLRKNSRYQEIEEELSQRKDYIWMLPYIQYLFLKKDTKLMKALQNLKELIEEKNYFVVTTCMNGLLQSMDLKKDRIVAPCGGFERLQCTSGECECLSEVPETLKKQIAEYVDEKLPLEKIESVNCEACGSHMVFNSLYAERYKEAGYLERWQIYTKWLQGTLNRKLLVLELGVSLDCPSVIRFPFEKIAYFNQKATFIRVHEKLYQLSEELGEKGISVPENAVNYLNRI